jgi:hypothetical protein
LGIVQTGKKWRPCARSSFVATTISTVSTHSVYE